MRLLEFDTRNRAFAALPASRAAQPAERTWMSWWVREAAPTYSKPEPACLIHSVAAASMGARDPYNPSHPPLCLTLLHEIQLKGEMNFTVAARGQEMSMHGRKKASLLVRERQRTGCGLALSPVPRKSCCRSCKGAINVPCNNVISLMDAVKALNAFFFFLLLHCGPVPCSLSCCNVPISFVTETPPPPLSLSLLTGRTPSFTAHFLERKRNALPFEEKKPFSSPLAAPRAGLCLSNTD